MQSPNEAADDVLLEGLRLGSDDEKSIILAALLKRATVHGLFGVVKMYDSLPPRLQRTVLDNIREMHQALRECGRSEDLAVRKTALKLVALGRQGKLAYILSENMRSMHADVSKAAIDALVALARWVATETKWLQRGDYKLGPSPEPEENTE